MKITSVTISQSRKISTRTYENADISMSLTASSTTMTANQVAGKLSNIITGVLDEKEKEIRAKCK